MKYKSLNFTLKTTQTLLNAILLNSNFKIAHINNKHTFIPDSMNNRINYKLFGQLVHTQNKEQPWRTLPITNIYSCNDILGNITMDYMTRYNGFIIYNDKYIVGKLNRQFNIVIFKYKFKIRNRYININKNKQYLLYENKNDKCVKSISDFICKLKKLNIEIPEFIINKSIIENV